MPRSASVFVWRGEGVRFWPVQDCDRCAVGPAAICRRRLAISGQSLLLLSISPRAYKCKGYLDEALGQDGEDFWIVWIGPQAVGPHLSIKARIARYD